MLSLGLVQGQTPISASTVSGVFTDASCTQPYQGGSLTFSNSPNDGSCPLSNSGAATAGFTNVYAVCTTYSVQARYYNTSAPATSNTSNSGICPSNFLTYQLLINSVTPLNTLNAACNSATLKGFNGSTLVYTTAACLSYIPPTSSAAVTSNGNVWRVQVVVGIVAVAMMCWL